MSNQEKSNKILFNKFFESGQSVSYTIQNSWIDKKTGDKKFTKRVTLSELGSEDQKVNIYNQRQIFPIEIPLDLDPDKNETYNDIANKANKVCDDLDKLNINYECYSTSSRGIHIHLYFKEMLNLSEKERRQVRAYFIKKYNADLMKVSEKTMIAREWMPHWKTGKLKELIKERKEIIQIGFEEILKIVKEWVKKDKPSVLGLNEKEILENPKLWQQIDLEFDKKIEGEKIARKIIFFVLNMRNVANLSKATDNLMINDSAGTGKDFVSSAVFSIIPDEEKVKRVRITPKVLSYLNDTKSNPEGWIKKCLYLEDIPNNVLNDDSFKVMSSSDPNGITQTSIVVNNILKNIDILGKASMIITIAEANPKPELLRRYPICNLDSSIDQTKAILKKQASFAEQGISPNYNPSIKKALSFLKRIRVRIPYASKIVNAFPSGNVIIRTHFPRFLDYIKSSCALYQYQRETDSEGYYLANKQDYEIAREILAETTSNQLMIPLTKIQKQVIEEFSKLESKEYSFEELYNHMQNLAGERWLRTQIDKLAQSGFIFKKKVKEEHSIKPVNKYQLNQMIKLELPKFEDLDNIKINTNNTLTPNNTINTNSANKDNKASLSNLHNLNNLHSELKNEEALIVSEEKFEE